MLEDAGHWGSTCSIATFRRPPEVGGLPEVTTSHPEPSHSSRYLVSLAGHYMLLNLQKVVGELRLRKIERALKGLAILLHDLDTPWCVSLNICY